MINPMSAEVSELVSSIPNLELRPPGIWFSRVNAPVSYPQNAHSDLFKAEDASFWFRHRSRCIVHLVRKFSSNGIFLDIGGGNGFVARDLAEIGKHCVLIEPGLDGALAAQSRGITPVICSRVEEIGIRPESIADCGLFDVIEHIENDQEILGHIRTWLRPGGHMFINVPAHQWLFSAEDIHAGHFRRYSTESLSRVLNKAGFEVVFMSYLFAPLAVPIFLLRALPYRLGLRRRANSNVQEDHKPNAAIETGLEYLLMRELRSLQRERPIPFGTSCLCVAKRRSDSES
jgi:SAM-dependent methyltransferase